MEKQGVPMNQYPTTPDLTHQHTGQPPVYQDPAAHQQQQQQQQQQQHFQQNAMYGQPGQQQYANATSPPPQGHGQGYQQPPQPQQYHQPQPQLHPGMPPQQQSGTVYQNVTPIANLNRGPAPVDCPACGQRAMTNVAFEVGNTTHVWALGLCCVTLLGCIPYMMNSLKDVQHKCGKCGVLLATWHRSGTTEVHLHA